MSPHPIRSTMSLRKLPALIALPLIASGTAVAGTKEWSPNLPDTFWSTPTNWSPSGAPVPGDDVDADVAEFVTLDMSALFLRSVALSGGAEMLTNGFRLNVTSAGAGELTIDGDATRLIAMSASGAAVTGDFIEMTGNGLLQVTNGLVRVGAAMDGTDGRVEGYGEIDLLGNAAGGITTGFLRAQGGHLRLTSAGGGTARLDAGAGTVEVGFGAILGLELAHDGPFDGTIAIEPVGRFSFFHPLTLGPSATVLIDNGFFSGVHLTNAGRIAGYREIAVGGFVNDGVLAAEGGTLVLGTNGDPIDLDGAGTGSIEAITGDLEIIADQENHDFGGAITIGDGHRLQMTDRRLRLTAGAVVDLTGGTIISDVFSQEPPRNSDVVVHSGAESFLAVATLVELHKVDLQGDLRVGGTLLLGTSADLSGPGTLILDETGSLGAAPFGTIAVDFRNEGTIDTVYAAARHSYFDADFEQRSTGRLFVDLLTGDADRLFIDGDAAVGGELVIREGVGYTATPGDTFEIITANAVTGAFKTVTGGYEVTYEPDRVVVTVVGCPADVDGTGVVDFADVLAVLAAWGPVDDCPPSSRPEDIDGDCSVDFADILAVLSAWGACP